MRAEDWYAVTAELSAEIGRQESEGYSEEADDVNQPEDWCLILSEMILAAHAEHADDPATFRAALLEIAGTVIKAIAAADRANHG